MMILFLVVDCLAITAHEIAGMSEKLKDLGYI
jgi:hypothetical protein